MYCVLNDNVKYHKKSSIKKTEDIKDKINLLINKILRSNYSIRDLTLIGAEPFVTSPKIIGFFIKKMYEKFNLRNIYIITNGTLLNEKYLKKFQKYLKENNIPENRIMIRFSIDGVKSLHDKYRDNSYDLAMKNLFNMISNTNFKISVISNISPETFIQNNYNEFINFINTMRNYNIIHFISAIDFTIKKISDVSLAKQDFANNFFVFIKKYNLYETLIKFFMRGYCYREGSGCSKFLIDISDNKFYSCEKEYDKNKSLGTWEDKEFNDIVKCRLSLFNIQDDPQECKECEYYDYCRNGCPLKRDENNKWELCYLMKLFLDDFKNNGLNWKNEIIKINKKIIDKKLEEKDGTNNYNRTHDISKENILRFDV